MNVLDEFLALLGKEHSHPQIVSYMKSLGVKRQPKLKKGEVTDNICADDQGVELVFRGAEFLKKNVHELPEGALVLSAVMLFGTANGERQIYSKALPHNLLFGQSKNDTISLLGFPDDPVYIDGKPSDDDWVMRWNFEGYILFLDYDEDGSLTQVTLQIPD